MRVPGIATRARLSGVAMTYAAEVRGANGAIGERLARMCSSPSQSLCGVTTRKVA
jgi:hypothetical protein